MSSTDEPLAYRFADFRLEPKRRLLAHSGKAVEVTDKAFDALVYLVRHAGRLVTKDELVKALWPATVVEDNSLYVVVSALRRALNDDSSARRLIATVAGRGYQFVAEVHPVHARYDPLSAAPPADVPSMPRGASHVRPAKWAFTLVAAMLLVSVGIGAALIALRQPVATDRAKESLTLAVLPFKPLTLDDRNESLELGMTETLIAALNSGRLSVSPLSSVRRFAGVEQDGLAAGRALGVQTILEGHIQRVGDKLRVSARLLDVGDGRQLWAQRYDEAFTDIFTVQDTIAAKVRNALASELKQESPTLRRYTQDAEAYQLYANGRYHLHRLALPQALAQFEHAVSRDSDFALAHVGIAEARSLLGVVGAVAPKDTFPQARLAVDRALEIAPDLAEGYASLGHIKVQYEYDWTGAEDAFRRALALNDGSSRAHQWFGLCLALRGRFDEGLAQLREAQALEPAQPIFSALIGMVLVYQRQYDQAIEHLRLTLDMDPDFPTTNTYLALAYLRRGDYPRAQQHLDRIRLPTPGSAGYRGQILALTGRHAEAATEIERLMTVSKQRYVSAYDIASIHAALGDDDETFEWLERALEERSQLFAWLPWDATFDGIRADARYARLERQLGPPNRTPSP